MKEHCPHCGSSDLQLVNKPYNSGCGCLGLLLFGFWGLLLGLFGMNDYELICKSCGSRWPVGDPGRARRAGEWGCGCGTLLIIVIILMLLSR